MTLKPRPKSEQAKPLRANPGDPAIRVSLMGEHVPFHESRDKTYDGPWIALVLIGAILGCGIVLAKLLGL